MTLQFQPDLPKERWDRCKFCNRLRKKANGHRRGSIPVCTKQGCPGQHVNAGIPLTQEERASL